MKAPRSICRGRVDGKIKSFPVSAIVCLSQGLRFRREAFSRLSPGTGNRPVPGENRQKPDEMALQIQKSGNRFFRPGTGVF